MTASRRSRQRRDKRAPWQEPDDQQAAHTDSFSNSERTQ